MFAQTESQKSSFLEQTKAAREERALEKRREEAAILLQATLKGFVARSKYQRRIMWVQQTQIQNTYVYSISNLIYYIYWFTAKTLMQFLRVVRMKVKRILYYLLFMYTPCCVDIWHKSNWTKAMVTCGIVWRASVAMWTVPWKLRIQSYRMQHYVCTRSAACRGLDTLNYC